jgi:hypothetical protein
MATDVDRGPVLLAVTWTWTGIATLLYILRAVNASVAPKDNRSISFFGIRWDFIWATIAYVSTGCVLGGNKLFAN